MDFEQFFTSAFNESDISQQFEGVEGESLTDLIQKIDLADYWVKTLLKALKNWEAAMRAKENLTEKQIILYSMMPTNANIFVYVFIAEQGADGRPVITKEISRFAYREYMDKLKEMVGYMAPMLDSADKIRYLKSGE